nr:hypothetical protein [Tanacetum cinerariifolium]
IIPPPNAVLAQGNPQGVGTPMHNRGLDNKPTI